MKKFLSLLLLLFPLHAFAVPQQVTPVVVSATGCSGSAIPCAVPYDASLYFNSALTNAAVAIKTTPGRVSAIHLYNPNALVSFVQVFNAATGSVTLGTTVPNASFAIPANGTRSISLTESARAFFNTAISIAATTTATGSTATGTPIVVEEISYY